MFEIKKREPITVKIYDVEYKVNRPKVSSFESLQVSLKKDDANNVSIMRDFLVGLGLPLEVLIDLEVDEFNLLVEYLISTSKKN